MIDSKALILLIETALLEIDYVVFELRLYNQNDESIVSTKKVLNLLKNQLLDYNNLKSQRILRAMHDIGMSSYKDFENTTVENAINNIIEFLYKNIPDYKDLKPLRGDFGKEYPI